MTHEPCHVVQMPCVFVKLASYWPISKKLCLCLALWSLSNHLMRDAVAYVYEVDALMQKLQTQRETAWLELTYCLLWLFESRVENDRHSARPSGLVPLKRIDFRCVESRVFRPRGNKPLSTMLANRHERIGKYELEDQDFYRLSTGLRRFSFQRHVYHSGSIRSSPVYGHRLSQAGTRNQD